MPIRNILVPVCPVVPARAQLDAALLVARRVEGHINTLYLRPNISSIFDSLARVPSLARVARLSVSLEAIERETTRDKEEAHTAFEAWRSAHQLACELPDGTLRSTYACWFEQTDPLEIAILHRGRLSDLIVLNFPGTFHSDTQLLFDVAVFDTGRPVLLAPQALPDDLLRHVVIAWNGSLQATRAVAGALSLLHAADQVSVFTAPWRNDDFLWEGDVSNDFDLKDYFVWHGIRAQVLHPHAEEREVGAALLRCAVEHRATMLIMGAFSRSRVRQILLGGVTRRILGAASIPVVMAH